MAEHTPGPWEEDITEDGLLRVIAPNAGDRHHETVCIIEDMETSTEQDHWNACLIAAAPELLAACEALVADVLSADESRLGILMIAGQPVTGDLLERTNRIGSAIKQARQVIAKARGASDD
ncbi:MAG: hypothetical protein M3R24_41500 [Chloroflexota bacterium]|nr:hypothetical protein [Chloroflexota bacterium]